MKHIEKCPGKKTLNFKKTRKFLSRKEKKKKSNHKSIRNTKGGLKRKKKKKKETLKHLETEQFGQIAQKGSGRRNRVFRREG